MRKLRAQRSLTILGNSKPHSIWIERFERMKHRLDLELDVTTELSPVELASKVAPLVREALEAMRQSFEVELDFDIFLVIDGRAVRFLMEPV